MSNFEDYLIGFFPEYKQNYEDQETIPKNIGQIHALSRDTKGNYLKIGEDGRLDYSNKFKSLLYNNSIPGKVIKDGLMILKCKQYQSYKCLSLWIESKKNQVTCENILQHLEINKNFFWKNKKKGMEFLSDWIKEYRKISCKKYNSIVKTVLKDKKLEREFLEEIEKILKKYPNRLDKNKNL